MTTFYNDTLQIEDRHFREVVEACYEIYKQKGEDYTVGQGASNRLYNFDSVAEVVGISREQAWAVYFQKHVFAVLRWAKEGRVESEAIESRFYDIINYCILGLLMCEDGG